MLPEVRPNTVLQNNEVPTLAATPQALTGTAMETEEHTPDRQLLLTQATAEQVTDTMWLTPTVQGPWSQSLQDGAPEPRVASPDSSDSSAGEVASRTSAHVPGARQATPTPTVATITAADHAQEATPADTIPTTEEAGSGEHWTQAAGFVLGGSID